MDLLGLFGKSLHKWVSAPQHFWISFQGEPEPPRSLGGPSSLCHCPKAQANPSCGCPSLPDTTWGCGSDQVFQQEMGQREHAGDDEQSCGQRAPRECPSHGSFYVHLSRLSLSQDELPVLSHSWKPYVYFWWFSPPNVTTGELAWLERVMVGQKTEILAPVLCLQFILSCYTNDILLSLFSIDEIALCDFFTFLCVLTKYCRLSDWGKSEICFSQFWSWKSEIRVPCGQVRALVQVTGFSLYLNMVEGATELSQVSYIIWYCLSHSWGLHNYVLIIFQKLLL